MRWSDNGNSYIQNLLLQNAERVSQNIWDVAVFDHSRPKLKSPHPESSLKMDLSPRMILGSVKLHVSVK